MTQGRPYSRVLVRRDRSSNGARAYQYTSTEAPCIKSGRKFVRNTPIVASTGISRRDIFSLVPMCGKSGSQTFLAFESALVRPKPYPHDCS
jgi:hypothetical protein